MKFDIGLGRCLGLVVRVGEVLFLPNPLPECSLQSLAKIVSTPY